MTDKTQIIKKLRDEFNRWDALLAGLTEAQITAPNLPENWSTKDVIAHLWAWQLRTLARTESARHNRPPEFPDWPDEFDPEMEGQPNDLNAWLYVTYRDKPWSSVYGDWKTNFLRLLDVAAGIPEDALLDKQRYPWLEGNSVGDYLLGTWGHHDEHYDWLIPLLNV